MTEIPTALTSVIVPYRDRGTDPLRAANLVRVLEHWENFEVSPLVIDDGRRGAALFNRSAAYNRGVQKSDPDTDVFIFAESDMLCPADQVFEAIHLAEEGLGMVVPFSTYRYQGPEASAQIRGGADPELFQPKWTMRNCKSIGAINIVSRNTMELIGRFDEVPDGNWYDDDMAKIAFEVCAGPTRFVDGPADHLYHLPGHRGKHLTDKEREATRRNQRRLALYESAGTPDEIRKLTMEIPAR